MEQMQNILPINKSPAKANAEKIFHALEGIWSFTRLIRGHGKMDGTGTFIRKDASTLLYSETGQLKLEDGPVFESYRNYIYELKDKKITVLFEDGRFFHELDFDTDVDARGVHECGLDLYRAAYRFRDAHNFRLEWAVIGPKKDYTIRTDFKRRVTC
jgi:hypothetical protein